MVDALYQAFPMRDGRRAQAWRHRPAFLKPRHFHPEPEVNVVLRGWARLGVGRHEVRLGPGEYAYLAPLQDHALLEASDDLEFFVFALDPSLAERAFGTRVFTSSRGRPLDAADVVDWRDRLTHLEATEDGAAVEVRLVQLFQQVRRELELGHVGSRRALQTLLSSPATSLEDLAQRIGMSRSELSRRVHGDWGVPLVELRSRSKLTRFVGAVQGGAELTAAAFDSDFGSYAQCHRVFRRAFGVSPTEWRQRLQRNGDAPSPERQSRT